MDKMTKNIVDNFANWSLSNPPDPDLDDVSRSYIENTMKDRCCRCLARKGSCKHCMSVDILGAKIVGHTRPCDEDFEFLPRPSDEECKILIRDLKKRLCI